MPSYSRSLFLPGPLPPATHLGVTLQRHCVVAGLRYTLYHLGFSPPETPPVRIFQLRLYLDVAALKEALAGSRGAGEIGGALVDPRGALQTSAQAGEVAAAALFHRLRLTLFRRRRLPILTEPDDGATAWKLFRAGMTRWLDPLNDAFLTETLAARSRRRRRAQGKAVPATLPQQAWAFRAGRDCRLASLGTPDLAAPSWEHDRAGRDEARAVLAEEPLPPRDPARGLFRETFRDMLSKLAPTYLVLADRAAARGLVDDPEDAFFVPFDLAGDLAGEERPGWIDEAVESNRREHRSYFDVGGPADELDRPPQVASALDEQPEAAWSCLLPLE